jgi:hypothetical protein
MVELIRHKGYDISFSLKLCDALDIRKLFPEGSCKVFGLSADHDDFKDMPVAARLLPGDYKSDGYVATFYTFVEPASGVSLIILGNLLPKYGTAYSVLTDVNGHLRKAADAIPENKLWQWSPVEITTKSRDFHSGDIQFWTSEENRLAVGKLPDKR